MFNGSEEVKDNGLDGQVPIPDVNLPKALRDMQYETAIFGKYGPGDAKSISSAQAMGFKYSLIYPTTTSAHVLFPVTLEKDGVSVSYPENKNANLKTCLQGKCTFAPDLFYKEALKFIAQQAKDHKPFFLVWTPNIPHVGTYPKRSWPYTSPVPTYGIYANKPWDAAKKGHAAMLSYVDRDIGSIMDLITQLGIRDNTYVLFLADNGQEPTLLGLNTFFKANFPLRGGKRTAYEGGIRVPAVVWGADVVKNAVSNLPFDSINLLPTITDLAGKKITKPTASISYLPIWKAGDLAAGQITKSPLQLQVCSKNNPKSCMYAFLRTRDWPNNMYKLVNNGKADELYDVITDESENRNLAKDPAYAAMLSSLQAEKRQMQL